MQVIYDIIGSIIIGGIILLMLLSFNSSVMEGSAVQTFNSIVQSNITTLTDIIEYDFRKMGYRVPAVFDSAIVYADSVRILMKGDMNDDKVIERLSYYFDPSTPSGHANPNTRVLYRQRNDAAARQINLGITRFRMKYFDGAGNVINENPVQSPSKIRAIRLIINIESTSRYNGEYAGGSWERTIVPKNLGLGVQP
jgi:hypothetical protein